MQALEIMSGSVLAHWREVDCSAWIRASVDDRRRGYADLGRNLATVTRVGGCFTGFQDRYLPEHCASVGIAGINGVMLSRDEEHVMSALSWDGETGNVKWLRVNLAIYRNNEELAELIKIDIRRRENCFCQILARSREVVVPG